MRYLLDTNVISELRRREGSAAVKAWVARRSPTDLAISVVTVIEIELGILRRELSDPTQARALRRWFEDSVLTGFAHRVLPVDLLAARRVAPLHVPDPAAQHDALIAGTALARGLVVATRNVKDFERSGAQVVDPWTA